MSHNKIEFLVRVTECHHNHNMQNGVPEHYMSITLLVDGKSLSNNGTNPIDIILDLNNGIHSNVDLWTCSCGNAGCLGNQKCDCNIVKQTVDMVTLLLRQNGKAKMIKIEKAQLQAALFDVLRKVQVFESDKQYNITDSDFGFYQLERYGEYTFGDNLLIYLSALSSDMSFFPARIIRSVTYPIG